MSMKILRIEMR